jgi:hypothetical protein
LAAIEQGESRAALKRLRDKDTEATVVHPPAKRLHEDVIDTVTRQPSHRYWGHLNRMLPKPAISYAIEDKVEDDTDHIALSDQDDKRVERHDNA